MDIGEVEISQEKIWAVSDIRVGREAVSPNIYHLDIHVACRDDSRYSIYQRPTIVYVYSTRYTHRHTAIQYSRRNCYGRTNL